MKSTHDSIMECITNLAALYHMADGWTDATMPFKHSIHAFDPKILPQMLRVRGEAKILLKLLSKELLRNDEAAIDIMFENLWRAISSMCKMTQEQRDSFLSRLEQLETV